MLRGHEQTAYTELYVKGAITHQEYVEKMKEIDERYDRINTFNR